MPSFLKGQNIVFTQKILIIKKEIKKIYCVVFVIQLGVSIRIRVRISLRDYDHNQIESTNSESGSESDLKP